MPEPVTAAPVVVPTPRASSTTAPAAPVAPAPPAPDASVDAVAKYKALEADFNKRTKEHVIERRKWESTNKATAEKLTRLEQLEKREQSAKTNPVSYLRSLYGDNWQQVVSEAGLTGATPAQLVQESIESLRAEFEAKDKAREENAQKEREGARSSQVEQARRGLFADAAAFYRAKADEYPLLKKLGAEPVVARTIANRIEAEFNKSHQVDEDGNVVQRGKILTESEAAELIEAEVLEWAAEAGKHEKYKAKLQPPPSSGTVPGSKQGGAPSQQPPARRSITNDITGSTTATKPPNSEKERQARAAAAFEAARRKG